MKLHHHPLIMNNPNPNPNASPTTDGITMANVMTGERTTKQITFAITGDPELDAIAGCLAVFNASELVSIGAHHEMFARVCEYLAKRFTAAATKHAGFQQGFDLSKGPDWSAATERIRAIQAKMREDAFRKDAAEQLRNLQGLQAPPAGTVPFDQDLAEIKRKLMEPCIIP